MSGLRDRMNRLRGEASAKDTPPVQNLSAVEEPAMEIAESERLSPDWEEIGVKLHVHEIGSFLIRKTVYQADHYHGLHALGELDAASAGLASFHPGAPNGAASERILFLDLETTGLGVGAGNVPFMIGIGYVKNGQYVIEQTIIRHPAEERAMLAYLTEKLTDFEYLATYNGKTFDWPLVQSRLIMNGLGRNIWEPKHLDFLHPARSIWRNTLASCRLSHVEEERLGIRREDDVPGSLAPQLYFQFLADGNPAPLEGVFRHNETDMLSLACLAIRFGHLLNGTISSYIPLPEEPEELVRTGIWLEKMGRYELTGNLYHLAENSEAAKPSTLLMLAARDKKAGNWNRAVLLWQKAVLRSNQHFGASALEASIELAMYYEHKLKDYGAALAYASTAFEHIQQSSRLTRLDSKKRSELDALRNRMARLNRKREKQLL
ncbi:ribonuclease H-like domain-containing protein [Paenibacillus sp. N4]|uniref:ribonuclease H-like domain-containing protein n=1 Tax=Paenibacillus vietnamensis TaxID=2590547 RepID=UPI001CD0D554|nr:ribonuclease H-like domain-containing protein [Paenibacillus vietnamensis]MCA0757955.1 ribonuclease H-like domain-containing protein [Paenibacillus vietnamensis]